MKLTAANMVRIVCGGDVIRKIEQIPMWSDTIRARIIDTTHDIKLQVTAAIKRNGQFSLQLDESTDVSDDAQLMAYVCYRGPKRYGKEYLLCLQLLPTTRGESIF